MKKIIFFIGLLWSGYLPAELYFGADGQYRHLVFKHERYGALYHKVPQANFIAGIKLNDYFGLEAGGHISQMQGFRYTAIKHDIQGLHGSLLLFVPMSGAFGKETNLILGAGVSHLISTSRSARLSKISSSKQVPRLLGAIQFEPKDNVIMRFSMIMEQVSQLKIPKVVEMSPRDTVVFSTGVYYKF